MPDVPAVHAHLFGQDVHHAFHGELRLVAAEAAHRAAVGVVRVAPPWTRRPRSPRDTGRTCGTRRAARTWRSSCDSRRRRPRSASARPQPPLGIGAHGERDRHRMALDVVLGGLLAREHRLHRPAQQVRRHRRLRLDRQLFLRAERAAARGQHDFDVRRARASGPWRSAAGRTPSPGCRCEPSTRPCHAARNAPGSFGLEKRDLDLLRLERRLDDVGGVRQRRRRRLHARRR